MDEVIDTSRQHRSGKYSTPTRLQSTQRRPSRPTSMRQIGPSEAYEDRARDPIHTLTQQAEKGYDNLSS